MVWALLLVLVLVEMGRLLKGIAMTVDAFLALISGKPWWDLG